MDKVAFLIIAHKNPQQVERLVKRLASPRADVFMHWDLNSGNVPPQLLQNDIIQTENRIGGGRYSFALVEITNELIRTAHKHGSYKYYYLLSGQDYLLCDVEEIINRLLEMYPRPSLDCTPWGKGNWVDNTSRNCPWYVEFCNRIPSFINSRTLLRKAYKALPRIVNLILSRFFSCKTILDRKGIELYGGSEWWGVPDTMIEYLITQEGLEKWNDLRYLGSKDETYYQTILMNSEFRNQIHVNPVDMVAQTCLTFANFNVEGLPFTGSPYIFKKDDFPKLKKLYEEGRLFARKFDTSVDEDIFDLLDKDSIR